MAKQISTEEFIRRAKAKIGNELDDFSKADYKGKYEKVCITCKKHGDYWITPESYGKGHRCPSCGRENSSVSKACTQEGFITKMQKIYDDKYDFSKFAYNGYAEKGIVICPIHGEFLKTPHDLVKGQSCPKCGRTQSGIKRTMSQDEFIKRARKIHGDKYNYDKAVYTKQSENVIITCPKHGDFLQTPRKHLVGHGCPKCGTENAISKRRPTIESILQRFKEIHHDKYTYEIEEEYRSNRDKIKIICPRHGAFYQSVASHLHGQGCPKCGIEKLSSSMASTKEEFISKAKAIFGDQYNYDEVEYVNNKTKVKVICPKHGAFWAVPNNHIANHSGCPKCASPISKWEQDVADTIASLGVQVEQSNRGILHGHEIDIFLPQYNIGIECDGLRWHNEQYRDKNYHLDKTNECNERGVRLIHIFEDEWCFKKDIWVSMLKNMLHLTENKIYARKCKITTVPSQVARKFLDENHIQGYTQSSVNLGLFHNGELVSLMTFGKPRLNLRGNKKDGNYELVRFANKLNLIVIGGASKLFKHFIKEYHPLEIVSYADKRWSLGRLYNVLGFVRDHDSAPNYYYVQGIKRMNRFRFRKDVLIREGYDQSKTEHEIMLERKIYRIYDCGTMVFKWHNKSEEN